jgi:hypothetical protein
MSDVGFDSIDSGFEPFHLPLSRKCWGFVSQKQNIAGTQVNIRCRTCKKNCSGVQAYNLMGDSYVQLNVIDGTVSFYTDVQPVSFGVVVN